MVVKIQINNPKVLTLQSTWAFIKICLKTTQQNKMKLQVTAFVSEIMSN